MTRHIARAALGAGALLVTGALALAGCGSGFDDSGGNGGGTSDGELTSSDDGLTILIGSSGAAETNCIRRRIAAGATTSVVMRSPRTPARAITSASPSLAQATPSAPAVTCRRAISGHRCVLA